jgi:uncharacterized protein YndB with AHSA1/START domain
MTTFNTSRENAASIEDVIAAFSDAKRLVRWLGANEAVAVGV